MLENNKELFTPQGVKLDIISLAKAIDRGFPICHKVESVITPKQKQVDSAVQDIMSAMFDVDENEVTAIVEMLQEREHLAKIN